MEKQTRNSSIELLKILAIVMIIFCHALPSTNYTTVPYLINFNYATTNIKRLFLAFILHGGQVGNVIFVICSSWFLLEKKKQTNYKKVLYILADCLIISILILLTFLIFGYHLSLFEVLKQFIPTLMEYNWFIGCYILLYLLHPTLNSIIKNLDKRTLLNVNIVYIYIYIYYCNLLDLVVSIIPI